MVRKHGQFTGTSTRFRISGPLLYAQLAHLLLAGFALNWEIGLP